MPVTISEITACKLILMEYSPLEASHQSVSMPKSHMDLTDKAAPGTVSAEVPVDSLHQASDK